MRIIFLFFFSLNAFAAGQWKQTAFVDGPAPAIYQQTPTTKTVFVDLPTVNGHATFNLESSPPNPLSRLRYFSGSSTVSGSTISPSISSKISIPISQAGQKLTATLSQALTKPNIAAAALAFGKTSALGLGATAVSILAAPYISEWFKQAGLISDGSGSFNSVLPPSTTYQPFAYTCSAASCGASQTSPEPNSLCQTALTRMGLTGGVVFLGTQAFTNPAGLNCLRSFTGGSGSTAYLFLPQIANPTPCISPYVAVGSACALPTTVINTPQPINETDSLNKLQTGNQTSSGDTTDSMNGSIDDLVDNGFSPDKTGTPSVSGSTTPIQTGGSTTTAPDGSVTNKTTSVTPSYTGQTVNLTQTTTTTTTNSSNVSTTTTTTSAPDTTPTPDNQTQQQTDCDKYPTSIGCSQYGTPASPETLETQDIPVTINSTTIAGSCPAPKQITLLHTTLTMSYQPLCDFAGYIKALFIALAFLSAGILMVKPLKD